MRRSVIALVALVVVLIPVPGIAASFTSCWVVSEPHPLTGELQQITRCRIAGGSIVDYASDNDVPGTLYPATGTDLAGQCWYYTSSVTQYVILAQYANGDADIGYDNDPANPGGIVAIGPTLPRCTSEPAPATDPVSEVWEYVMEYIHPPPSPDLSPTPGEGVTGLETYVGVPVPDVHTTNLSSGPTSLEVYIEVSQVIIDWGDGATSSYPPNPDMLSGYPHGSVKHIYEAKSDGLALQVAYDWTARWRTLGGAWDFLAVPNTTTSVDYPLAEIISDLTD